MKSEQAHDAAKLSTRETRLAPVYLLTGAQGGPKLRPSAPGSCVIRNPEQETAFVPSQLP
jgi:hypothetical protein